MRELSNQVELRPETYLAAADSSSRMNYSLGSLMLLVTLACGLSGVWALSPPWAILLTLCSGPALIRTAIIVRRLACEGQVASLREKLQLFFIHSCEVFLVGLAVFVIGLMGIVAFVIILFVLAILIAAASNGSPAGIAISLFLFLGLFCFVVLWMIGRRRKEAA